MKFTLIFVGLLTACQPQPTSDSALTAAQTTQPTSQNEEPVTQKPTVLDTPKPVIKTPRNMDKNTGTLEPIVLDNEDHPAVTKVVYTQANGSLPPPAQYQNDFQLTAEDTPNFDELVNAALDNMRVNDVISLRGYMVLRLNNDPRAEQVRAISAGDVHPKGGQSTTMAFVLADGREFKISNYAERLRGTGLRELQAAAHENGHAPLPYGEPPPP